ncbi:MAG: ribonuclease III, partial [Agathobacter sp.]|nr:ribonuclease III [Agathobacter sp.]
MEMKIDSYIKEQFQIKEVDVKTYSPLALAYIGDGIFDLVIRTLVVGKGNTRASQLHYQTSHIVKAQSQAKMIEALEEHLTEEEADVYRRGRNAKSNTAAKNASIV